VDKILENTPPPPGGGKYQPMSFGGKNIKSREQRGKCKTKNKKAKRKVKRRNKN
jgi:hypothetical protein